MAIECEAKIPVPSLNGIRSRLDKLGAATEGAVFEENWVFDDAGKGLGKQGTLLRLRINDAGEEGLLTVKRRLKSGDFKCREELETAVSPASACHEQLLALGYRVVWRYQKKRENRLWRECRLALDECPELGFFVEIEGDGEAIRRVCGDLDLDPAWHAPDTYLGLWLKHLAESGQPWRDMLFPVRSVTGIRAGARS